MRENLSFTLRKDIRSTFSALTELERLAALSSGQLTVSEVPGRPRSGAGSAVLLKSPNPAFSEVLCETLEWDPPKRCVRRLGIKDLPATVALSFSEAGGETEVSVDVELVPQSMVYKMMLPVLAQTVRSQKEKALTRLRQELDAA